MCVCMWVQPHVSVCGIYLCQEMKAVSIGTNPTISTSSLNDRDIIALFVKENTEWERGDKEEKHMSKESIDCQTKERKGKITVKFFF